MSINIITGYTGNQHITSEDDGAMNAGIVGGENYVMETLEQFAYEQLSANKIKIKSGDLVVNGRHARIRYGDYVEAVIENGSQTMKRNDLIVARYEKNTSTGVESFTISTIKGTPSTSPTDPLYVTGNILTGDTVVEFPLYRVVLDGINIESVTKLFEIIPTMTDLQHETSTIKTDLKDKVNSIDLQNTNDNIKDLIIFKTFTGNLSLNAGETKEKVISCSTPSGYKALGIVDAQIKNTSNCVAYSVTISGQNISCWVRNWTSGTNYTANIECLVAYIRNL